jgi:hypothetical protein
MAMVETIKSYMLKHQIDYKLVAHPKTATRRESAEARPGIQTG